MSGLDLESEPNLQGAVVGLPFPEAMWQLDLQRAVTDPLLPEAMSERDLRGAMVESFLAFLLLLVRSTELGIAARTMKSSPVSCPSSPRPAETELVERGGVGGSWTELVIPGVASALDLQGTVEPDIPEAVSKLDLESELNLQGVVAELGIVARTMKSSPVSYSSSPRSAETELVERGGVGGSWTELVIPPPLGSEAITRSGWE